MTVWCPGQREQSPEGGCAQLVYATPCFIARHRARNKKREKEQNEWGLGPPKKRTGRCGRRERMNSRSRREGKEDEEQKGEQEQGRQKRGKEKKGKEQRDAKGGSLSSWTETTLQPVAGEGNKPGKRARGSLLSNSSRAAVLCDTDTSTQTTRYQTVRECWRWRWSQWRRYANSCRPEPTDDDRRIDGTINKTQAGM